MIKIGLIGEDPNDTLSIKNLLLQKLEGRVSFVFFLKNIRGYQLDNPRVKAALTIEFKSKQPKIVIFIRDADAIITETKKLDVKKQWFTNLNVAVENSGVLLLNIYELEALILADIDSFNKDYKTDIKFPGNVCYKTEPKEFLISKTFKNKKTYRESDCPRIFELLEFDVVKERCQCFSDFYDALEAKIK